MSDESETVSSLTFSYHNCGGIDSLCDVVFNFGNSVIRAYGWMHACVSYDFYNKSLRVTIDQQVVHTEASNDLFAFQSIRASWVGMSIFTFPEMFTLLNIYTRSRIVE